MDIFMLLYCDDLLSIELAAKRQFISVEKSLIVLGKDGREEFLFLFIFQVLLITRKQSVKIFLIYFLKNKPNKNPENFKTACPGTASDRDILRVSNRKCSYFEKKCMYQLCKQL